MRSLYNKSLRGLIYISASLTMIALIWILSYILIKGIPGLSIDFIMNPKTGILPSIIATLEMVAIALSISAPIGIFAAIYLTEYAKQGRITNLIRFATESLSGIPSIIYGLFGMLFFVKTLGWGWSLLSGSLTASIMILPTIVRSTEETIKSVPAEFREASYGLGATKIRTIFRIILPTASPGILASMILSIGRVVGETAALVLTAGTVLQIPGSAFDSGRTMSVHLYLLAKEGISFESAFATATVLILTVLLVNFSATYISTKMNKNG
ncbi:MAG: phosphate ABC transporter permease PstA [Proteocatella sp.]